MDACGKLGEHDRSERVARGAAESNSSFLSALQTSQVFLINYEIISMCCTEKPAKVKVLSHIILTLKFH